jgi:hypothetical protein
MTLAGSDMGSRGQDRGDHGLYPGSLRSRVAPGSGQHPSGAAPFTGRYSVEIVSIPDHPDMKRHGSR